MGGHRGPDRRTDLRRLPPGALAGPDRPGRGRRSTTVDARRRQGPVAPLLARRPHPRVHLGSPDPRRGRAGPAERQGSRGQGPGPPAAAGRPWRGPAVDRPAAGRRGGRVVARWSPAGRRLDVARGDLRCRCPPARHEDQAEARRAARLRLSIHRPARVHAQRAGVPVRQDPPPLAGRRGRRARRRG